MKFTKTPPKEPGFYAWKNVQKTVGDIHLVTIKTGPTCYVEGVIRGIPKQWGGEWCRLVPVDEVKKAKEVA